MMPLAWLRPLTSGELLDVPFKLMRARWGTLTLLHLLFGAPVLLLQIVLVLPWLTRLPLWSFNLTLTGLPTLVFTQPWPFVGALALGALHAFPQAAAARVIANQVLDAAPLGVRQAVAVTWRRALTALPAALLLRLLEAAALLAWLLPFGWLLSIFAGLPILCMLSFALEVAVLEGASPWRALRRSAALTQGLRMRLAANAFCSMVVLFVAHVLPILLQVLLGFLAEVNEATQTVLAFGTLATMIVCLSSWPTCSRVLAYLEARVRKEGLDLQMAVEARR